MYFVLQVAKELTETCYQMYKRTPFGAAAVPSCYASACLAPEYIEIKAGQDFSSNARGSFNLQRPEAVEAFFVLYRVTGDTKYQEYGWEVFSAMETFTRVRQQPLPTGMNRSKAVDDGYTGIKDVTKSPMVRDDTMQSFFLAETLKYLYLLFSPTKISLDQW
eukprot:scaffold280590_cov54-Prasinocladus_malaysianus.AAC.1